MRLPVPALIGLIGLALIVLVGLGVWQLQRNEWKQGLVEESHAKTDAPPLVVDGSTAYNPDEVEYHRVVVEGEPQWDDVMFLANRARSTARGEEIILPVVPASGAAILVNLGWIPDGAREDVLPDLQASMGTPISGLALDASGRNGNQIPSGSWSNLDPGEMSEALGYDVAGWFVLAGEERTSDPLPTEPLPVAGWQRFQNTTPHIEYALTWFGLAIALAAIAVIRFVVTPRRDAKREARTAPPASDEATR